MLSGSPVSATIDSFFRRTPSKVKRSFSVSPPQHPTTPEQTFSLGASASFGSPSHSLHDVGAATRRGATMLRAAWRRRRRFILGRAVWRWRQGAAVEAMLEERREHARVLALVRAEQVESRRRMAELQAQSLKVIQAISLQSTARGESDSEGRGKGGESLSMVVLDAGKAHDRDMQEQLLVLHEENANLMSRLKRHTLDASSMLASKAALERLLDERVREIDELQQMRGLRRSQLGEEEAGGEEDAFGRGADDEEGDDDQQLRDPIKTKQRGGGKRRSGGGARGEASEAKQLHVPNRVIHIAHR
jgi:hypothetical protein